MNDFDNTGDFDPFHNDAFFHDDGGYYDGNHDDNGDLSKFESFMQRKQERQSQSSGGGRQQQQRGGRGRNTNGGGSNIGNGGANNNNFNALSPRSESDGMSYVSRMKHDNYHNVVMEMKKKQSSGVGGGRGGRGAGRASGGQYPQQQQQGGQYPMHGHQGGQYGGQPHPQGSYQGDNASGGEWQQSANLFQQQQQQPPQEEEWAAFDNNNDNYTYFSQHPQSQHNNHENSNASSGRRPSSAAPTPPRGNHSRQLQPPSSQQYSQQQHQSQSQGQPQQQSQSQPAQPPQRIGRKLYQDPTQPKTQRSRSTVRRTADRTQQLAQLALNYNSKSQMRSNAENSSDNVSCVGSDAGSVDWGGSSFGEVYSGSFVGGAGYGGTFGRSSNSGSFGGNNGGSNNSNGGMGYGGSHSSSHSSNRGRRSSQEFKQEFGLSGSGSVSNESLGFTMQQHQQRSHSSQRYTKQSSQSSIGSGSKLNRSLDSFVGRSSFGSSGGGGGGGGGGREDDNCSVASGTGSVAARRRAKSRQQQQQQQQQQNGGGGSGGGTARSYSTPPTSSKSIGGSNHGGSNSNSGSYSTPRAIPPHNHHHHQNQQTSTPSSAGSVGGGSSARRNMRRRMQASSASPRTSFDGSSPIKKPLTQQGRSPPRQPKHNMQTSNHEPDFEPMFASLDLSSDTIDQEVNLALSELKLSHPDIIDVDFGSFGRLESGGGGSVGTAGTSAGGSFGGGSNHGGSGSFESSYGTATVKSNGTSSDVASLKSCNFNNKGLASTSNNKTGGLSKMNNSGGGGRTSPHTVSTKSMTISHTISDTNNSPSTLGSIQPALATSALGPVISVEQYSESSSLTDDVGSNDNWQLNHAAGKAGVNIFKKSEMGSTFHKSKKIVRPGESPKAGSGSKAAFGTGSSPRSIPEGRAEGSGSAFSNGSAGGGAGGAVSTSHRPPINNAAASKAVPMTGSMPIANSSSVRDRISQFKNTGTPPTNNASVTNANGPVTNNATTPRQSGGSSRFKQFEPQQQQQLEPEEEVSQQQQPQSPANSIGSSSVSISPFRQKDVRSTGSAKAASSSSPARDNRLPPTTTSASASAPNSNPFAVKLRKTKHPISPGSVLASPSTASASVSAAALSPLSRKETINATSNAMPPSPAATTPSSYANINEEEEAVPKNPFLAQVKLRKTKVSPQLPRQDSGVDDDDWHDLEQEQHQEEEDELELAPKKLTWREQQELKRQQQEQQQEESEPPPRKLTWREQQELKRQQQQQQQQELEQQELQQQLGDEGPKKKLSYREQQESLRQQHNQQQDDSKDDNQPQSKDVAALIRERIAANKQHSVSNSNSNGSGSGGGLNGNSYDWRGNLKKTSGSNNNAAFKPPMPSPGSLSPPRPPSHALTSTPNASNSNKDDDGGDSIGDARGALNAMFARRSGSGSSNAGIGQNSTPVAATAENENEMQDNQKVVAAKESVEEEEDVDPRAALMAMLNKRGGGGGGSTPVAKKETPTVKAPKEPMEKEKPAVASLSPAAHPLAAMLQKRSAAMAPPPPSSGALKDEDENSNQQPDPRSALMGMLANRGGGASPAAVSKKQQQQGSGDKNAALSAMLANRASLQTKANDGQGGGGGGGNGRPSLRNDPKYEKYFKMLKVGMPLPVVQHAMTRDGFDPSVMDGNHDLPAPEPKPEKDGNSSDPPLKHDPAYAKYFKMLKLGLPMGAVKNAMERDGLDPAVMDGDHNKPVGSSSGNKSRSAKKRERDTHRRTRLHWDTLADEEVNSNSVWALVEREDKDELDRIEIDEKEFTTLFQAEIKNQAGKGASAGGGGGANRNVVQVIDPKRANNGGIILARLRMSYDDLAQAVERIDETAMTANQAQGIIEYMPTLAERKSLRDYMKAGPSSDGAAKSFERLCECEKFMVAMMTVKQSKRKIRALLFKLQFRGCIHDLAHDVFSIEKACDELSNSVRLRKLFGIVLNIGNRLNTAGPGQKRKAGAFTLKSLLKLNQAKAFDNKTTFLHYVVLVVQRNSEALLDFKEDLPTVLKADKIYWDQCVSDLEEVETQLENVRKLALHEAKSNKIVYQLPNKNKPGSGGGAANPVGGADNDSDDFSIESMSLEDEVSLLRSTKIGMFALSAIRKVSQLRERVDTAKEKFTALLEYFGEGSESKMQPHELFEIITTFCRTFDVARADVEKIEKAKKRGEKKDKDNCNSSANKNEKLKAIQENRAPPQPVNKKTPPPTRLPRASSHQPNMANVLKDIKRASSSKFKSPNIGGPLPPTTKGGTDGQRLPNKAPANEYPDDESSPEKCEDQSSSQHSNIGSTSAPYQIQRRQQQQQSVAAVPHAPQGNTSSTADHSRARIAEEEEAAARAQQRLQEEAEAMEVAMAEEERRHLAQEATAAEEEALRRATEEKQMVEQAAAVKEAAKIAMEERQLAEERAAAEEAARIAMQQKHKEEAEAAAKELAQLQRQQSEEAQYSVPDPAKNLSSKTPNSAMTRREVMTARRERARNRHFSKTPTRSTASTPAPSSPMPTTTTAATHSPVLNREEPKQEAPSAALPRSKQNQSPTKSSSNASARASARDRYARHKKMLHQRKN